MVQRYELKPEQCRLHRVSTDGRVKGYVGRKTAQGQVRAWIQYPQRCPTQIFRGRGYDNVARAERWLREEIERYESTDGLGPLPPSPTKLLHACEMMLEKFQYDVLEGEAGWDAVTAAREAVAEARTGMPGGARDAAAKTPQELVQQCNKLARAFYASLGYQVPEDYQFQDATHPQERGMWNMAAIAMEELTFTSMDDVLVELDDADG